MNLTALQHSPFLQSLGWAIANSLWQAAALWVAYHLISGAYKVASAKFKNSLSTILLSLAFVWFCVTLFTKYFSIENISLSYQFQEYQQNNITITSTTFNWKDLIKNITGILPYLSVAYLLLLIFLSIRLINIYRFTRFIKFNGLQKPGVEWKLFTEKVARHMGITKKIRLWVSHHIDVPATIGFIKPVILIPLASINQLSADQLEAIILHELSHIKRNDYLINLLISIIETILFFNPFVVLLSRIIKRERENCCDDFVIQYQYDRHTYASALLSLEQSRNIDLRLAIGATSGKKQLLLRIKRIMEINNKTNFNYGQKLVALLLITGIICSIAWLSPQKNQDKRKEVNKNFDEGFKINIKEEEKPISLNLKHSDNKVKNSIVKPLVKKELTQIERQLKELKELNATELAAIENNRLNFLSQQSKKQVIRKKIYLPKISIARGAIRSPNLFDNDMALFPARFAKEMAEFNTYKVNDGAVQKLQKEWENVQFSFSFDGEQMQNRMKEMKEVINSKQFKSLMPAINLKAEEVQKLIKAGMQNSDANARRVEIMKAKPEAHAGTNHRSFYFFDSLMTLSETNAPNENPKQLGKGFSKTRACESGSTTSPKSEGFSYAFGYGNSSNEIELVKITGDVNKSRSTNEKKIPVTSVAEGVMYHILPNSNNNNTSKPKLSPGNNVCVSSKNGVIVINGKLTHLTNKPEMLAFYSLKDKKILSRAKNLIEPHIND